MTSRPSIARAALLAALAALCAACAGKPFNVKTVPKIAPDRVGEAASAGPLAVRASAVWDEDWLLENFDANLVLAGVLPVRVDVENGGDAIEAKDLKFEVTDGDGRSFKWLDAKKAAKAVSSYYEITVTSKTGPKAYQEDFASNALDTKTPLARGERRQGFVFFAFPKDALRRPVPATLRVSSKTAAASVALAAGRKEEK